MDRSSELGLESLFGQVDLEDLFRDVRVVSFDFFDTLFLRKIHVPEDVFDLIAKVHDIPEFRKIRIDAQKKAFIRMTELGNKEINIDDIYAFVSPDLPVSDLKQTELKIESILLTPNPELFPTFLKMIEDDRFQVVITSDMYLESDFFNSVLSKYLTNSVELLISCNEQATKRDSGELFSKLLDRFNVAPHQVLHIGDNYASDFVKASSKKLKALHYKFRDPNILISVEDSTQRPNLASSIIKGLFLADRPKNDNFTPRELGQVYGGPANLGFLRWVSEVAKRDQVDLVLFLARDGFTLYQMSSEKLLDLGVPFRYFVGSRTAFNLASIDPSNFCDFIDFLVSGSDGLAIEELFERIGVAPPPRAMLRDLGFGVGHTVTESSIADVKTLFYAMRRDILQTADKNRRALFSYIQNVGIRSGQRVALVDVGWSGSSQESFERAISQMVDIEVFGYYFCLIEDSEKRRRQESGMIMKSLFNSDVLSKEMLEKVYRKREIVELFFSAPEETVIGYNFDSDFRVSFVRDKGRGATTSNTSQVVLDIVAGAMEFSKRFNEIELALDMCLGSQNLSSELIEFVVSSKSDNLFVNNGIRNFDAWGSSRSA